MESAERLIPMNGLRAAVPIFVTGAQQTTGPVNEVKIGARFQSSAPNVTTDRDAEGSSVGAVDRAGKRSSQPATSKANAIGVATAKNLVGPPVAVIGLIGQTRHRTDGEQKPAA
jgi:hypothetical protein